MSFERKALVESESSALERVSAALVGVGILTIVFGWTSLFQWTTPSSGVFGIELFDVFGVLLTAMGLAILAIGVVSRAEIIETAPDDSAGLVPGVLFGLLGFVAGGLIGSQTLGLGAIGWLLVALLCALAAAAVTVLPREDVGSSLSAGVFTLGLGLAMLTGVIGPGWAWNPEGFSITFTGAIVVPVLAIVGGLIGSWAAAKAHDGFGTRGRQAGAYLLIAMNAFGMLAILLLLVVFIVKNGWAPMTRGTRVGFFWEPVFWFRAPVLDEYVIFNAPGIWFYWPFTMQGFTLSDQIIDGVLPAIVGTVWVVIGAVLFAVPLGVGAAVYLTEYAEQGGFTRAVEIATNGLWSTPSIVYGLFGYAFLVPRLGNNNSLLTGQLILGFMLLPLVLITSREALKSVPDEYRDASAALGVGQWETIRSVVLPAAMPGVITGVILGVGRIAGETAPILLVMGGGLRDPAPNVLGSFQFTSSPPFIQNDALLQPASALPYKLFQFITAGVGAENTEAAGWATALVLLLVVMSFYAIGIGSRIYFRRKLEQ